MWKFFVTSEQVIWVLISNPLYIQNPNLCYHQNSAKQVIKPKRKAKKHKLLPSQFLRRPEMSLPGIQSRWLGSPTGRQFGKRQRLRHRGDRPVFRLPRRPRLPTRIGRTLQADVLLADVTELPLPREAPLGKGLYYPPILNGITGIDIGRRRRRRRRRRRGRGFV